MLSIQLTSSLPSNWGQLIFNGLKMIIAGGYNKVTSPFSTSDSSGSSLWSKTISVIIPLSSSRKLSTLLAQSWMMEILWLLSGVIGYRLGMILFLHSLFICSKISLFTIPFSQCWSGACFVCISWLLGINVIWLWIVLRCSFRVSKVMWRHLQPVLLPST